MPEKMLRASDIDWAEVGTSADSHLVFCMRKEVPVYFKVNRERHLVYRHHHVQLDAGSGIKSLPFMGIDEELVFLRLDNSSLAEIALSRSSFVPSFSGDGFSIPRPYRITGHTIPARRNIGKYENITDPTLEKVEFYHAFLIDKKRWELSASELTVSDQKALEECKDSLEIRESDLYFTSTDIAALKKEAQESREVAPYPYAHRERMPGIYWMFQAAYAHNDLKILLKENIKEWLLKSAGKSTYRHKSIRTAKKFVQLSLDRAKGGPDRGNFYLENLGSSIDAENYKFSFASEYLSAILVIADWWAEVIGLEPDTKNLDLAKRLDQNQFGGLEIGDLVYLISGSKITEEENTSFEKYLKKNGKPVRRIIDKKP